jgi:AICAR transformylase/IMP cyclohydrolase PurH
MKIQRALISVTDKTGVVEFARALSEMGVELLSTGGTAKAIREAGVPVKDISEFTGFPEMLDGRVKTLHPKVHAGLLHLRGNAEHEATMKQHGLLPIDLVCVNLYRFEATVAKRGVSFEDAIENIDIGGPSMLRSAAKNQRSVTVVCDPADYGRVLASLRENGGNTTEALRRELAQKVYARTAQYDAAIAGYLAGQLEAKETARPFVLAYAGGTRLRYGENPHQDAHFYKDPVAEEACVAHAEVLHGKEMSFNNYVDGDAALEAVKELAGTPAVAIIKHTNPCGYATGATLAEALEAAWAGDPVSSFGSVIAVTVPVDLKTAEVLKGRFVEALIAPAFAADALEFLKNKSKDIRLLRLHRPIANALPGNATARAGPRRRRARAVDGPDRAVVPRGEARPRGVRHPRLQAREVERHCHRARVQAVLLLGARHGRGPAEPRGFPAEARRQQGAREHRGAPEDRRAVRAVAEGLRGVHHAAERACLGRVLPVRRQHRGRGRGGGPLHRPAGRVEEGRGDHLRLRQVRDRHGPHRRPALPALSIKRFSRRISGHLRGAAPHR